MSAILYVIISLVVGFLAYKYDSKFYTTKEDIRQARFSAFIIGFLWPAVIFIAAFTIALGHYNKHKGF